ncbi:5-oxoprolinase subunit PxpB [Flavitalea antarctica]
MQITYEPETESSVRICFGTSIDEMILRHITSTNEALHHKPFPGFIGSVPAYTTLTVFYDPLLVTARIESDELYAFQKVISYLKQVTASLSQASVTTEQRVILIPVCYGGSCGPDIEDVAEHNKLQVDEVIRLHAETIYTVYMVGFQPGFPYLGGMNKKLETPRRLHPRKIVPGGSVGIAGAQTGIYPLASPGGWQLIGRTPMPLFDPLSSSPVLLRAGNRIRFSAISYAEFRYLSSEG